MVFGNIGTSIVSAVKTKLILMKKNNLLLVVLLFLTLGIFAQDAPPPNSQSSDGGGISVSPSTLRFNAKPGQTQSKTIKVNNDTDKKISFQVSFQDYGMGREGKTDVAVNSEYKNALSKYIVVSPTLIELKPRESKLVSVTVDIPPGDAYAIAMWTTLALDEVIDRKKLEVPSSNNTVAMGINASVGFGIHIYQNPPNVIANSVDIQNMKYNKPTAKAAGSIAMKAKNTGDGIGYCLYYLELTELLTGKQTKFKVKQFGILPGYEKEFTFDIPTTLPKGKYSALAVIDFGDKNELRTAELDFVND